MTLTPRELMEQDRTLEAREAALALPEGDAEGLLVRSHTDHLASQPQYEEYYRTMRGGFCPEPEVFTRHHFVKRFASIRKLILERKHKTVLDLGCLDGWQLLNLAAQGVSGVGVDLCPQALVVAGERAAKWGFNLKFIESSIEDFEYKYQSDPAAKDGFDAVILSEVLEHVLDPVACLKTAVKHLAPGGVVYISVPGSAIPHHGKLEDAREHLRIFTQEQLKALAKDAGLAVVQDTELIEEEDQGFSFYHQMMSFRRARITVYCNHVTGGWNPQDVDNLGASEEMVVKVAEAWVRQGQEVTVHQNGFEGSHQGVVYLPRAIAPEPDRDLMVLYKTLEHLDRPAGIKIFWTTDLPQPGQVAAFLPPVAVDQLDAVLCISEYHRTELLKACPWLSPEKTKAHWLGIDPQELCSKRNSIGKRVIYASSPDRGLGFLLEEWSKVREAVPDAELRIVYGFDFWKKSEVVVPAEQSRMMREERARLEKLMNQSGVTYCGRLSRKEYLQEMAEASIWAYPCTGGELCCKTALEAQFLNLYPVVIPTMVLQETVQTGSKVTKDEFIPELIRALKEDRQADTACIPTWEDLATFMFKLMEERVIPISSAIHIPSDSGAQEEVLPERFECPNRVNIPKVGLDILMAVRGMAFDGDTDRNASIGGSETAAIQLSRALVKRGHHVSVFSNLPGESGKWDGVNYLHVNDWSKYAQTTSHDVSIVQRDPTAFNQLLRSKLNVLWAHDLGLKRYRSMFRPSLWNVDYVAPVSHWHAKQLCEVYDLPASTMAPMYNGIEIEEIRKIAGRGQERDPKALVYASRPERGLDVLLQSVFPRLLERDPKLTLYICGYDNTTEAMAPFYAHCQQLIANFGARAKWMGYLKKADLYRLYSRAQALLYPSRSFEEVYCITATEAAACGLPFVGTTLGALPEVTERVPGFAQLVTHPGDDANEAFISEFVDAAWNVISNQELNTQMSQAGLAGSEEYSWDKVAEQWEDFLLGSIELRSQDSRRIVRHWWRLGDINGLSQLPEDDRIQLTSQMSVPIEADTPAAVPNHILQAVAHSAAEVGAKTILALSGTQGLAEMKAIASSLSIEMIAEGKADFVYGIETLDCSTDPHKHIYEAENMTNTGGHVCLIVTAPGTHQSRLMQRAERKARWVFDNQDMRELTGHKPELLLAAIGGGDQSVYDHSVQAWSLHRWKVTGVRSEGRINFERRRLLQAPAPSLSGCLIVKDSEDSLHRCLKSIRSYCDEIVVDDNGSTDNTKAILAQYGITPATGPSPIEVGFDEARNENIQRATGDYILWIDSDEKLLDAFNLPKYLRWNLYDGYGISQHHFSAVPQNAFKPDLPVRIFRRLNLDGTSTNIRFWGFVHEHPEKQINHSVGQSVVVSDVHLGHDGYLTEAIRRKRFNRNIPLMFKDRLKYPDRVLGKFLMIRDWCHLGRYEIEQNGQQMVPAARAYLEAAVEAYRKDFLGLTHIMGMDGLQYYNEALQLLNKGFETQIVLKVGGLDGQPHEVQYSGRVASKEDMETLIAGSVRDLAGVWDGKYL